MLSIRRIQPRSLSDGDEVSHIELFFDLVFVFAITRVTATMAENLTWHGVVQGLLLIALLWWSWVGYSWLGNVVHASSSAVRVALFAAMSVMFVAALAIPEAFDDLPGGLPGPVVIAFCYFVFRALHLALFWIVSRNEGDIGLQRQLMRFAPSMLGGTATLLIAAAFDGWAQTAFWALALVVDYGGTFIGGASGWRLKSAAHFAERHALILIIALGESFIAIGVGVASLPISTPIIFGAIFAMMLTSSLWWVYFDKTIHVGASALKEVPESDRARLGRDAYSFLHLPLIASVVLMALGAKKAFEYIGDNAHHSLGDHLSTIPVLALFGGLAMFLIAEVAFGRRIGMSAQPNRFVGIAATLLIIPLALNLPAIAALALVALLASAIVGAEALADRQVVKV